MEKIGSNVPLRSRRLTSPIIFAANIPLTYYNAMGMAFYKQIGKAFQQQPKQVKCDNLLGVTVSPNLTIEQRAERMATLVKR